MAGWSHLSGKKGLVSGLILAGDGVGISLLAIYYNKFVNYEGIKPELDNKDGNLYLPAEVGKKFPGVHFQLCIYLSVMAGFAMLLVSNYKPAP